MTGAEAKSSGIGLRAISALVLAPAVLGLIVLGGIPFIVLMLAAFGIALREWHGLIKERPFASLYMLAGSVYLACCFLSFTLLRLEIHDGAWWSIGLMLAIWASDCGAYFTGKVLGGPKLAPAISPKKTWAGLGGAVCFAGLALLIISFAPFTASGEPVHFFLAGLILGAVGQAGDLLESIFKRRSGLKDSGNLIPGHGGLLDRIDALLLASPVFLFFVWGWLQ